MKSDNMDFLLALIEPRRVAEGVPTSGTRSYRSVSARLREEAEEAGDEVGGVALSRQAALAAAPIGIGFDTI